MVIQRSELWKYSVSRNESRREGAGINLSNGRRPLKWLDSLFGRLDILGIWGGG